MPKKENPDLPSSPTSVEAVLRYSCDSYPQGIFSSSPSTTPADFVEEQAKRRQPGRDTTWLPAAREPYLQSCDETQSHLSGIRAAVVETRVHLEDDRGTIYAVSLAFREPQEHCYQLVRYLERQAIRRGVGNSRPQDADRSLLPCAATRRTTAARSWEQWRLEHPLIHKM